MNTKQQRTVKAKEHKVSRNEGWAALSWDDLTEWAGSRSVERGRTYHRQGRVHELAATTATACLQPLVPTGQVQRE